jgi:uncharacterized membrane protein YedE/YeeE
MRHVSAFVSGGLFGLGLYLSGMTDTARVQAFLDVSGSWDPTLAFVLGGAVLPMIFVWRIAARRSQSVLGTPIPPKPAARMDARLISGSLMFGAGWALAGFCPGPAIAVAGFGGGSALIFLAAMITGMFAARALPVSAPRETATPGLKNVTSH